MTISTSHEVKADPLAPPRGPLELEVEAATRTIHREVWGKPYRACEGPMHHAGGGYWRAELLRLASRWERLAKAARICAETLPRGPSPHRKPRPGSSRSPRPSVNPRGGVSVDSNVNHTNEKEITHDT